MRNRVNRSRWLRPFVSIAVPIALLILSGTTSFASQQRNISNLQRMAEAVRVMGNDLVATQLEEAAAQLVDPEISELVSQRLDLENAAALMQETAALSVEMKERKARAQAASESCENKDPRKSRQGLCRVLGVCVDADGTIESGDDPSGRKACLSDSDCSSSSSCRSVPIYPDDANSGPVSVCPNEAATDLDSGQPWTGGSPDAEADDTFYSTSSAFDKCDGGGGAPSICNGLPDPNSNYKTLMSVLIAKLVSRGVVVGMSGAASAVPGFLPPESTFYAVAFGIVIAVDAGLQIAWADLRGKQDEIELCIATNTGRYESANLSRTSDFPAQQGAVSAILYDLQSGIDGLATELDALLRVGVEQSLRNRSGQEMDLMYLPGSFTGESKVTKCSGTYSEMCGRADEIRQAAYRALAYTEKFYRVSPKARQNLKAADVCFGIPNSNSAKVDYKRAFELYRRAFQLITGGKSATLKKVQANGGPTPQPTPEWRDVKDLGFCS